MHNLAWRQSAVIYEVYSRSFQDSDGVVIGHLGGIIQRLNYLVKLGVDAIWRGATVSITHGRLRI
jgi:alpha-glucosidase